MKKWIWAILIIITVFVIFRIVKNRNQELQDIAAGNYDYTLEHDGLIRSYIVHIPPAYNTNKKYPVVIMIHGGGGNAEAMQRYVLIDKVADKEGFIVVYPDGTGKTVLGTKIYSFDAGRCCTPNEVDDVGFISKMIDKLGEDFNIDKKRVYATGLSNGAQMSYRLACELGDKIAAIVPVSAIGFDSGCALKRPVPTLHIHGTADTCAPYNGGVTGGGCTKEFLKAYFNVDYDAPLIEVESVPSFIEEWKTNEGLPTEVKASSPYPGVTCASSENEKTEVSLCTIEGTGHIWPGESYGNPCKGGMDTKLCKTYISILGTKSDWYSNQYIWDFFKKYSL